jgi:hypothetical protein
MTQNPQPSVRGLTGLERYGRDILLGDIQEEMTSTLLPTEHFDGIGEDARGIAWFLPRLEEFSHLRDLQSVLQIQLLEIIAVQHWKFLMDYPWSFGGSAFAGQARQHGLEKRG